MLFTAAPTAILGSLSQSKLFLMKISDIIQLADILPDLRGRNKKSVLEEMCQALAANHPEVDSHELLEVLTEREMLGSTGIGEGIALPHGKLPNLDSLLISCGRSKAGVDFDAMDGKPAHIFFMVVAPANSVGTYLKVLAQISQLLKSQNVRQELMSVKNAQQMLDIIRDQREDF